MARSVQKISFVDFAEKVIRLRLTNGQRVLARVAFDGVDPARLDPEERAIARTMFGEVDDVPALARRIIVLVLGRNSGKTTLASAFALYTMLTADVSECGPGSVPIVVTIAPVKRTAKLSIRMALEMARTAPPIAKLLEAETNEGFFLRRPDDHLVGFEAFAASRGGAAARGFPILSFLLDEAQFFSSSDDGGRDFVVNDNDVYSALIPRLMTGGKGIFLSTPWPVPTLMGSLFDRNFGDATTALAARAPTAMMRDNSPSILSDIELERAREPENARREFDCISELGGSGTFFDSDAIEACVNDSLVLPAASWGAISAGADTAFTKDSSTIAVVGSEHEICRLLALHEQRPRKGAPLKPSAVFETFAEVVKPYNCTNILGDHHYAESAREHLGEHGISLSALPGGIDGKAETYLATKRKILDGQLVLPRELRLLSQLRSIRSKPSAGGSLSITTPRRAGQGHGDLVSALVGAVWGARNTDRYESLGVWQTSTR